MIGRAKHQEPIEALVAEKVSALIESMPSMIDARVQGIVEARVAAEVEERLTVALPAISATAEAAARAALPTWIREIPWTRRELVGNWIRLYGDGLTATLDDEDCPTFYYGGQAVQFPIGLHQLANAALRELAADPFTRAYRSALRAAESVGTAAGVEDFKVIVADALIKMGRGEVEVAA